jgi:hypothetical protein
VDQTRRHRRTRCANRLRLLGPKAQHHLLRDNPARNQHLRHWSDR